MKRDCNFFGDSNTANFEFFVVQIGVLYKSRKIQDSRLGDLGFLRLNLKLGFFGFLDSKTGGFGGKTY